MNKSAQNSRNRKRGQAAENIVALALKAAGFVCIEPIHTGWVIIRKFDPLKKTNKIVSAFPKQKVSGDFKAIEPGTGKAVHVEVKSRKDRLLYSAIEKHQIEAMDNIVLAGGISYLAWVNGINCRLYRWPIDGFGPRKSLKWNDK